MRRCWTNACKTCAIKDQCIPHDDSEALVIVLRGRLDVVRSAWEKRRNGLCIITQVQDLVFEEYQRSNTGLPS
jgi:hypothetical protein